MRNYTEWGELRNKDDLTKIIFDKKGNIQPNKQVETMKIKCRCKEIDVNVELSVQGIRNASKEWEQKMKEKRHMGMDDETYSLISDPDEPFAGEGEDSFELKLHIYLERNYPGIYYHLFPVNPQEFDLVIAAQEEIHGNPHYIDK